MTRAIGAALLGAGLLLAGGAFDSPSLHVPGAALLTLGAGSAAWVSLAAAGARLERAAGPRTVVEDEPYPLAIRWSSGLVPPPMGELDEPLLGRPLRLGREPERRITVDVRFSRRGRRQLAPARVELHDPLRLAVAERRSGEAAEVIVLPRLEPVVWAEGAGRGGAEARRSAGSRAATELELDTLRPYRAGTAASRIHWPTVARSGELVERVLAAGGETRPLVVLDTRSPCSGEALDEAVRAAASLTAALARAGGCELLLPGDRRPVPVEPDMHGFSALHLRLALVEEGAQPPAAWRLQRAGAVLWVTAATRVPVGLERTPAASRWLVTPATQGRAPAFTVAGCGGHRLGRGARRAA